MSDKALILVVATPIQFEHILSVFYPMAKRVNHRVYVFYDADGKEWMIRQVGYGEAVYGLRADAIIIKPSLADNFPVKDAYEWERQLRTRLRMGCTSNIIRL